MEEGKPSATAVISAMFRANHLLWDQPPKILEDTFALQLSGCESETALKAQIDQLEAEFARATNPGLAVALRRSVTAAVVTRSRYLEGEVDEAIKRGVSQYVILGAGLDSFAYRRPDLAKVLHVCLRSRSPGHTGVEADSSELGRYRVAGQPESGAGRFRKGRAD